MIEGKIVRKSARGGRPPVPVVATTGALVLLGAGSSVIKGGIGCNSSINVLNSSINVLANDFVARKASAERNPDWEGCKQRDDAGA